jgi:hypothetical protein
MDFLEGTVLQVLVGLQGLQGLQEAPQRVLEVYVVFEDLLE